MKKKSKRVPKKVIYNHMLDVAFTIKTPTKDWKKIPVDELVAALQKRVDYLKANPVEAMESFGYSDSYVV